MNTAEKVAAAYLRLNGFLLLPNFTILAGGDYFDHVDLVGLRARGSWEGAPSPAPGVPAITFPTDDGLFEAIPAIAIPTPREQMLGVVAEVKTNRNRDGVPREHLDYVRQFLGGLEHIVEIVFSEAYGVPAWHGGRLEVGNAYALNWIVRRVEWMNRNQQRLLKSASWTWSEDFLADILVLRRFGAFKQQGN